MLQKTVMKTKESDTRAVPGRVAHVPGHAEAPRSSCSRVNDTLVPVESARIFVERLRPCRASRGLCRVAPGPARLRRLASLRCQATTSAVADFLEAAGAAVGPARCRLAPPQSFVRR